MKSFNATKTRSFIPIFFIKGYYDYSLQNDGNLFLKF